mmetsp:Transcript_6775/g.9762  ORF Transcript_6775/g.9762 Transcript_6775/m.9762 type:complete len:546 (-) Transcript_6775:62-1699(-)
MTLLALSTNAQNGTTRITNTITIAATTISSIIIIHSIAQKIRDKRSQKLKHTLENDETKYNDLLLAVQDDDEDVNSKRESKCIYLDYNGTTPIYPPVFKSMIPYLSQHFGNPSSGHAYGTIPRMAVQSARRSILKLLFPDSVDLNGCKSDANAEASIVFTGCGSEADNLAIHLAIHSTNEMRQGKKGHVVTSNVEHPAISECLKALEARGEIHVTYVPVNNEGIVESKDMISELRDDTILVTLMLANNESGALQPIRAVSSECHKRGILFHTDAAQAVGKVSLSLSSPHPPDVNVDKNVDWNMGMGKHVDMVTIVGHKFGAPKGIAALYIRPGCLTEHSRVEPKFYGSSGALLLGGGQEGGRRAGTENVPYIVALGRAADLLTEEEQSKPMQMIESCGNDNSKNDDDNYLVQPRWKLNAIHMERMRSRLLQQLKEYIGNDVVRPNGPKDPTKRLPNTLSVGLCNIQSGELLKRIQDRVACSAGSACHASGGKLSSVLVAMNVPIQYAAGTLRLSVGPSTTCQEIDEAALIIANEAKRQLSLLEVP